VTIVFLLSSRIIFSQSYFNEVYNIDDQSILINGLIADNNRILTTYKYVNPQTLLNVTGIFDKRDFDFERIEFENFNSSRLAFLNSQGDFLLMYETLPFQEKQIGFKVLDQSLSELNEFSFLLNGGYGANVTSSNNSQELYLANANFINDNLWETNLIKLDSQRVTEWNLDIGSSVQRVFPADLQVCNNDDIILSTITAFDGSLELNGQLYRVSPTGEVLWDYTNQSTSSGSIIYYVIQLSNGNFVHSTELDVPLFGQYRFPPVLSWINSDGMIISDTVFTTSPGNHILTIKGMTRGNGDYFFVHGTEETGGDNSIKYGWIMKVSNDGNIIWNKNYKNYNFADDRSHFIDHLDELDNGDIITSGGIRDENGIVRLWIMGLNMYGCFGAPACDNIVSNTTDNFENVNPNIFPNPTSNIINLPNYNSDLNYSIIN